MTCPSLSRDLCRHFAALVSYPHGESAATAASCLERLRAEGPEAAHELEPFVDFVAGTDLARVEEVFTATFDLQPVCHPYVGYQLVGESRQRAFFLMELQRLYREHGFTPGEDLADHLGNVLSFLACAEDETVRAELVADGVRPALDKLLADFDAPRNPYRALLRALQVYLENSGIAGVEEVAP